MARQRQGNSALFLLRFIRYILQMPAKDRYHDTVVRALTKDGWSITEEQVKITLAKRRLYIDIRAVKADENLAILVEVKGFENTPSQVEYLASVVGKYVLYTVVLSDLEDSLLYLAVPEVAYNGVLSEPIGEKAIQQADIRLIVFDPEREEIVQWIS
jgi:hypothetical protein